MTILITIFAFILTIGLIVLIHEGGHYLAAKALGIEVRRFSIGMGPVLAKFNAWKTEFAVSALPIGGYVAFVEGEESDPPERKAVLFGYSVSDLVCSFTDMTKRIGALIRLKPETTEGPTIFKPDEISVKDFQHNGGADGGKD